MAVSINWRGFPFKKGLIGLLDRFRYCAYENYMAVSVNWGVLVGDVLKRKF